MLLVKTKLGISQIHGIGCFADEPISKGTLIWKFNALVDKKFSEKELHTLPTNIRNSLMEYMYKENGAYILCGDNARFFNHSEDPNTDDSIDFPNTRAAKDILIGEEITSDYRTFDKNWEMKVSL